jgi:cytosine/adenosine deaminase-related metal-dependent hydrolase
VRVIRCEYLIADPDRLRDGVIADAALVIEGGRVVAAGPWSDLRPQYGQLTVEGGPDDRLAVPGLVNAHHHGRGLDTAALGIEDAPLEFWLPGALAAAGLDAYASTACAAAGMLRSGITTSIHNHSAAGTAESYERAIMDVLRAYEDVGVRVALATGVADQQILAYVPDAALIAGAPAPVRAHIARWLELTRPYLPVGDCLAVFDACRTVCGRQYPRASLMLNARGPQWASDDLLRRYTDAAQRTGAGVQIHLLETARQRAVAQRRWGTSAVAALDRLGLLGPRTTAAHVVWVDDADIDLLAASGTSVVTNTSSNLRLGSGLAPLQALKERGVNLAVGTDSAGLFGDDDLWKEMRLLAAVHRTSAQRSLWLSPYEALRMATVGGARAALLEGDIGRLLPGYRADVTILSLRRLRAPYLDPSADVVGYALSHARASDVDTVLVDGEALVSGGVFTRLDIGDLESRLASSARAMEPLRRQVAAMLPALRAHLAVVYEGVS